MKINEIELELEVITKENAELFLSDKKYFKNGCLDLSGLICLKRICNGSFKEKNIKSIVLPASLQTIDREAFRKNQLKEVVLSHTQVVYIGHHAFEFNKIESLKLPGSLRKLGVEAFANNRLKEVNLSCTGVGEIRAGAFADNRLRDVKFPKRLEKIGYGAFEKNQLKMVDLSNTQIEEIDCYAFAYNDIEDVKFPNLERGTLIYDYAFLDNEKFSLGLEEYTFTFPPLRGEA